MYWALGEGIATGQWPSNSGSLVTGGTARYRLYPTRDGQVVAAAPIEQKFWQNFCSIIGSSGSTPMTRTQLLQRARR
jgi:crotonobetainyl-CoA:carnitine CoA-transferase CaiB-like acyl-CoA transferase